jgi:hypothetical protein
MEVLQSGIVPVANQAARDALTPIKGLRVDRADLDRVERYSGSLWQPISGKLPHRSLLRNGTPTIASSTDVLLTSGWLSDADDAGDACGITYSGGVLTAGFTGWYSINATYDFSGINATGSRLIRVMRNGGQLLEGGCGGHIARELANVARRVKLTAGDTLQLQVYQSSGVSAAIAAGDSYWQVSYLNPA